MNYPDTDDLQEGKFTNGNPVAGIPASVASAEHMNAVYDEIIDVISDAELNPEYGSKQLKAALHKRYIKFGDFGLGTNGVGTENGHSIFKAGFYSGNGDLSSNFPSDRSRFSGFITVPYLNSDSKVSNLHFDDLGRVFHQYTSDGENWAKSELYGTKNADMCGSIWLFTTLQTPAGFLKANGAEVSRTLYAELFSKIGTTYGAGDGINTFNLPDVRADFP
ncbi:hypothetical protein TW85_25040, partial [Marinomonas sp. S3726]|uniref:phage tail protein n=1 Tax=Marinomonas sp. S3726 TaxID=579484 RepID=UPI0005FA1A80